MHILISGEIGVGKTTLINKLLQSANMPVYGFRTEKNTESGHVYIHGANGKKSYTEDNIVGLCTASGMRANPKVFESLGTRLLADIPAGSIVAMDELGFLESGAPGFCRAVLDVMNGPYLVLAAVKPLETDFLRSVREHNKAQLFRITMDNRDALYEWIVSNALIL